MSGCDPDPSSILPTAGAPGTEIRPGTDVLLDALPASIALLDENGTILTVNEGWRTFARENGFHADGFGRGANYLAICDAAAGAEQEDAKSAGGGIRDVLSGRAASFAFEYPCQTQHEERWFRMMVTPLKMAHTTGAVVMHFDITARQQAERLAKEGEARYLRQRDALIALTSTGISDGGEPGEAFRQITETSARTLNVERASIWRFNKERTAIRCVDLFDQSTGAHVSGLELHAADFPAYFQALTEQDVIAADDALTNSSTLEFADCYLRPHGISSMMDAAIRVGGKVEGVLCHEHVGPMRKWTTDETTFAISLASLVNTALEGWERRITLEAVLKVAQAVSTGTVVEFFDLLTQNMIQSLDADGAFVGRVDRSQPTLLKTLSLCIRGRCLENRSFSLINTAGEGVGLGYAAVVGHGARARFPEDRLLQEHELDSFVGIPLFDQNGNVCGAMAVMFEKPLEQMALVHSILKIFATRAAGELERQEADARIHEQASLLDKAQDAILVRGLDHRILYWNKSAERLYGWKAEEALGRSAAELLYHEPSQFEDATAEVIAKGEWTGELIQLSKSGDEVLVEGRWTLVRDEEGRPKSILAINTDVTDKKRIEAQFLRAQRMESIGTLAGGVAHDLNNVLAPIMMAVDLLRLTVTEKQPLALISTIDLSARRGADMVRQVLSFARGVDGQRVSIDPRDVVRDVEQIIRDSFPKNIDFHSLVPKKLGRFAGDPTQVHQVMLNLCVNARDAMPAGGTLALTVGTLAVDVAYASMNSNAKVGDYISLAVADTGTGMSQKTIDKIFDPFFTTKELGHGTGLGLSTTLGIVISHGGFIDVTSEMGKGSTFTVFFPADANATTETTGDEEAEAHPRGESEMVLIVDDEQAVREITADTLEAFGYHTLVARDGAEAIAVYAQHQEEIDVVLTDIMMPVMDGPAAIQVMKRMNPNLKIIAASGLSNSSGAATLQSLGVTHLLPKPYTAKAMLRELRSILNEG